MEIDTTTLLLLGSIYFNILAFVMEFYNHSIANVFGFLGVFLLVMGIVSYLIDVYYDKKEEEIEDG